MADSLSPKYMANAAVSGLLFGAGLYVSQMVDPLKVLRFLDFGGIAEGTWDPSLAFVIVSAIGVMFVAIRLTEGKARPWFNGQFHRPDLTQIDRPLVLGAVLFGIGWGMSGICPGPAITLIAFMPENLLLFLIPMFIGSYAGSYLLNLLNRRTITA